MARAANTIPGGEGLWKGTHSGSRGYAAPGRRAALATRCGPAQHGAGGHFEPRLFGRTLAIHHHQISLAGPRGGRSPSHQLVPLVLAPVVGPPRQPLAISAHIEPNCSYRASRIAFSSSRPPGLAARGGAPTRPIDALEPGRAGALAALAAPRPRPAATLVVASGIIIGTKLNVSLWWREAFRRRAHPSRQRGMARLHANRAPTPDDGARARRGGGAPGLRIRGA